MNTKLTAIAAVFQPSPQQSAFFDWITNSIGSCVLEAVAGAGKTTTLVHGLSLMSGKIFFGAFSKNIVVEIAERVRHLGDSVKVSTMHAEGFGALRRAFKNVRVDNDKCRNIFRGASEKYPEYRPFESIVLRLAGLAKQSGIGIVKDIKSREPWAELIDHFDLDVFSESDADGNYVDNTELIIRLARKVLEHSNSTCHDVIDFDDMIYAPLFHKVKFFQYDWVLVDEAQDTNVTRRLLALAILKKNGRLVAVGDRHQAIFGFTGADADSLNQIAQSTNATLLPLNVTYRCPKAVVAYAKTWVSHIEAAPTAPEGVVRHDVVIEDLIKTAVPGDAVLCRFNAPLVEHAYAFIAAGIPALIEGRDIADGLLTLARRWKRITSYSKLLDRLATYEDREVQKYKEKEQESKVKSVQDKVGCLRVIIGRAQSIAPDAKNVVERVCEEINAIFAAKDGDTPDKSKFVIFSSGHKSKGREWNHVVWLQTGPSPWARKDWEIEQEDNLCYVMATRAKAELIIIAIKR